ncbi:MAG: hypothetical protein UZ14_CFX002002242 [Chloroflexi bacterium OLB14]|nr:MAG: hypothetical protein UZ14_CFX002002242 [Chloroflexi bacterium OLB14]
MEIVFQQKYAEDVIQTSEGSLTQNKSIGFWEGQILDFSNGFYLNNKQPISFEVYLKFERPEILGIKNLPKAFIDLLSKNQLHDTLIIKGTIKPLDNDRAEMQLTSAEFDQKQFYLGGNAPKFLPDKAFNAISDAEKRTIFENIMSGLENAFLRIPPDRFVSREVESSRDKKVELSAETLKNWLFQSSHDEVGEKIVRDIIQQFNSNPFNHGNVSIVRVGNDEIEALIEGKNGLKLPIGKRGTGVQQILTILSYITQANSPFVGIEELEINLSPETQRKLFTSLLKLLDAKTSPVRQIFFTTHSPHIGKRNEAERRGVWMEKNETKVKKPSEANVKDFFKS